MGKKRRNRNQRRGNNGQVESKTSVAEGTEAREFATFQIEDLSIRRGTNNDQKDDAPPDTKPSVSDLPKTYAVEDIRLECSDINERITLSQEFISVHRQYLHLHKSDPITTDFESIVRSIEETSSPSEALTAATTKEFGERLKKRMQDEGDVASNFRHQLSLCLAEISIYETPVTTSQESNALTEDSGEPPI